MQLTDLFENLVQDRQTQSAAFRRWFGASKVVDAEGRPLVVYHGTNQPLVRFDRARRGASTGNPTAREAFFFSDHPEVAADYAAHAGETLRAHVAAYEAEVERLRLAAERLEQHAQRTRKAEDWSKAEAAMLQWESFDLDSLNADPAIGQNLVPAYLRIEHPLILDANGGHLTDLGAYHSFSDAVAAAQEHGNDGLIVRNLVDSPTMQEQPSTHYAVFHPNQIKSAIGNSGSFSRHRNAIHQ